MLAVTLVKIDTQIIKMYILIDENNYFRDY